MTINSLRFQAEEPSELFQDGQYRQGSSRAMRSAHNFCNKMNSHSVPGSRISTSIVDEEQPKAGGGAVRAVHLQILFEHQQAMWRDAARACPRNWCIGGWKALQGTASASRSTRRRRHRTTGDPLQLPGAAFCSMSRSWSFSAGWRTPSRRRTVVQG